MHGVSERVRVVKHGDVVVAADKVEGAEIRVNRYIAGAM
jgi:hypothetical protein